MVAVTQQIPSYCLLPRDATRKARYTLPVFTGRAKKKHCRAMLFANTAREHGWCEQSTRFHGPCWQSIHQSQNTWNFPRRTRMFT